MIFTDLLFHAEIGRLFELWRDGWLRKEETRRAKLVFN